MCVSGVKLCIMKQRCRYSHQHEADWNRKHKLTVFLTVHVRLCEQRRQFEKLYLRQARPLQTTRNHSVWLHFTLSSFWVLAASYRCLIKFKAQAGAENACCHITAFAWCPWCLIQVCEITVTIIPVAQGRLRRLRSVNSLPCLTYKCLVNTSYFIALTATFTHSFNNDILLFQDYNRDYRQQFKKSFIVQLIQLKGNW